MNNCIFTIPISARAISASIACISLFVQVHGSDFAEGRSYKFKAEVGQGAPACDAYVELLERAKFLAPPFCGKPSDDSSLGFERLDHRSLNSKEIVTLITPVWSLMQFGDSNHQGSYSHSTADHPEVLFSSPQFATESDLASVTGLIVAIYNLPSGLGNAGEMDHVLLWRGYGATDSSVMCGDRIGRRSPEQTLVAQRAFILQESAHGFALDQKRTESIFGATSAIPKRQNSPFIPIADDIELFRFKGRNYLSLQNKKSPWIEVVERDGSKSHVLCRIRPHWTHMRSAIGRESF
jgi:hypothetical protein